MTIAKNVVEETGRQHKNPAEDMACEKCGKNTLIQFTNQDQNNSLLKQAIGDCEKS